MGQMRTKAAQPYASRSNAVRAYYSLINSTGRNDTAGKLAKYFRSEFARWGRNSNYKHAQMAERVVATLGTDYDGE